MAKPFKLASGKRSYKKLCSSCERKPYMAAKGPKCEHCGFIPLHPAQLDVDHINGDHKDNRVENLQTLCANCHRLKTILKQDFTHN